MDILRKFSYVIFLSVMTMPYSYAGDLDFINYIKRAQKFHPLNSLQENQVEEVEVQSKTINLFPNPQLKLGRENQTFSLSHSKGEEQDTKASWSLGISQEFLWPGSLSAKRNSSKNKAIKQINSAELAKMTLLFSLCNDYIDYILANKVAAITRENLSESQKIHDILQARRKQGLSNHNELLQSTVEVESLKSDLESDESNILLQRTNLLLQFIGEENNKDTLKSDWPDNLEEVKKIFPSKDLLLEQQQIEEKSKLDALAVERLKGNPSFTGGLDVMREDGGMFMFSAMVGFSLPLSKGSINESNSLLKNIVDKSSKTTNQWYLKVKQTAQTQHEIRYARLLSNKNTIEKKLLILANEHYKILRSDFALGQASLTDINLSRKNILNFQLLLEQIKADLIKEELIKLKIQIGLASEDLNKQVQKLGSIGSMSLSSSGMQTMKSSSMKSSSMKMKKSSQMPPSAATSGQQMNDDELEETPSGGMGGMGGM